MKPDTVAVFVTNQKHCENLIKAGKNLLSNGTAELKVVSIRPPSESKDIEGTALDYLYQVCLSVGASMTVLYEKDPVKTAVRFIRQNKVKHVVIGVPECMHSGNFAYELHQAIPAVSMSVVTPSGVWYSLVPAKYPDAPKPSGTFNILSGN